MNQNPMMNNPILQIQTLLRAGKNPNALVDYLSQNNPQVMQAKKTLSGKSPAQLEQFVRNACAERHVTVEDFARSFGIQIPSNR